MVLFNFTKRIRSISIQKRLYFLQAQILLLTGSITYAGYRLHKVAEKHHKYHNVTIVKHGLTYKGKRKEARHKPPLYRSK